MPITNAAVEAELPYLSHLPFVVARDEMTAMGAAGLVVLVSAFLIASVSGFVPQMPGDDYWDRRASILSKENSRRMGGDLELESANEQRANQILMSAKFKELDAGFRAPSTFLPAWNFMQVASNISNSPVFKIIEKMPKGGVLHSHDATITSLDYLLRNITYRPNLYVCDVNSSLKLKFLDKPSNDCQWQLLNEVRKKDKSGTIDERIVRQMTLFTKDPATAYPDIDTVWVQFLLIFDTINPLLSYRSVLEDYFYQGLLELYNDNVFYMEMRSYIQPLYDLDGKTYDTLEVARIYKQVADKFVKDHPDFVGVKLIYDGSRQMNDSQMDEHLKTARQLVNDLPGFIVGCDISNQEDKGRPLVDFADKFRAIAKEVPYFFHAAETIWNGEESDENLIDAVLLGTKRIGHGFGLTKHPEVLELARQKGIALELQPISNQVLTLVKDLRNHPANALFAENYPVVVSNDNPSAWGIKGLSYDFYEAFMGIMSRHADLRALKKLAINSIEYSSMNASEKKQAMEIWQQKWKQFVNELAAGVLLK